VLRRTFILVLITLIAFTFGYGMDVTRDEKKNEYTTFLTGQIVPGDLAKIVASVSDSGSFPKYFTLDSPGGDLLEAMKIGHFIRETATGTFVAKKCSSACVFVLVAGTSRTALDSAAVGLHRPYFEAKEFAGLSLPEAEEKHRLLRDVARRYLEEMEMTTAAVEKMFSIASDDVYYLTPQEKARLLVPPSAYSEWIRAKCSPPTSQDRQLFKARGFNVFQRYDKSPPTDPAFWAYISKMDRADKCEEALVKQVRAAAMLKYRVK
jgi:ATP-dependent protease ClpP protease subunit